MIKLLWEKAAQTDRENIYIYFHKKAGEQLASKVDIRFQQLAELLQTTPLSGIKIKSNKQYRKLVMPNFPFIMIYRFDESNNNIHIFRLLHTSTRLASIC